MNYSKLTKSQLLEIKDTELTKRIIEAGKIMGIPLVDSVIVTTEDFFSMKESLLLNWE